MTTFFSRIFNFPDSIGYEQTRAKLMEMAGGEALLRSTVEGGADLASSSCTAGLLPVTFTVPGYATLQAGVFTTPSLAQLRRLATPSRPLASSGEALPPSGESAPVASEPAAVAATVASVVGGGVIHFSNIVGESRAMHQEPALTRPGTVIQAASQFNCLEFVSPTGSPDNGIACYEHDHTQGPACAIACAAGTAVRNYLARLDDRHWCVADAACPGEHTSIGQRGHWQINNLYDVQTYLRSVRPVPHPQHASAPQHRHEARPVQPPPPKAEPFHFTVINGYVESTKDHLDALNKLLADMPEVRDEAIARLRIGVMWDTQVTDGPIGGDSPCRIVTQTFNSALSIGYSDILPFKWEGLAQIVLDATYEATLLVGLIEQRRKTVTAAPAAGSATETLTPQPPCVLLTKIGGGVFRNKESWIKDAIVRACKEVKRKYMFPGEVLNVKLVHYRSVEAAYEDLPAKLNKSSL